MFNRWLSIFPEKSHLLIGPRRCGKTTVLKNRFPDWHYSTLDDLDFLKWAEKDPKGFVASLGDRAIIDEIQRFPKLFIAVKYAIDNMGARVLMTGSTASGLLDPVSETLAGRIAISSLPTACWGEEEGPPTHSIFDDECNPVQIAQARRLLEKAMEFGQFPEVIVQNDDVGKSEILKNYRNSYFTRDMMQLSNIENLDALLALYHNLSRNIGSHLEVSHFARESGLSNITTKKYLNTLEQTQLTFKLYGYHFGPAKRYMKTAKTYFADNGIITGFGTRLSDGQMLENFVVSELEKRRKLGYIKSDGLFYYKTIAGKEIDLVFESDGTTYAVEIKATENPSGRDIGNLRNFQPTNGLPLRRILFYGGDEYQTMGEVRLIPIAAIYRGG